MKIDVDLWSHIGVFLTVFRHGSTLAASKQLGLSQVTVARRIDALERILGLTLFRRDTRGAHPTESALALAEAAARIDTAVGDFSALAERLRHDSSDHIRIAAPSPNFSKEFSRILAAFTRKHTNVQFSLLPSDQAVNVGAGDADMAILYTRQIDDPSVVCRKLGVERTTFYASREYLALNGLPPTSDDLQGQSVIGIRGDKLPAFVADWIAARVHPDKITTRCENIASLVAAIQMGKGIGPLPITLGDTIDGCERCFDPPEALDVPIWLAINPGSYRRSSVRAFSRFLAPRLSVHLRNRDHGDGLQ